MKEKLNHNKLAIIFPVIVALGLALLVYDIPEISIAPLELTGRTLLKVAVFFASWALGLRFLGGWTYSVTAEARKTDYGMIAIACAIIIGTALVIAK
jgi:hypothetical protein